MTTAGFGIKDSIQCVIDNQYEQILHYDNVITFKSDVESEEINNIISSIKKDEYYKEYTTDYGYTADVKALGGGDSYSTEITVVDNTDKYSDFVTFRTRKKHNQLELNDDGVTIVMITHEPDIARCAKRIMYIRDGELHGEKAGEQE